MHTDATGVHAKWTRGFEIVVKLKALLIAPPIRGNFYTAARDLYNNGGFTSVMFMFTTGPAVEIVVPWPPSVRA